MARNRYINDDDETPAVEEEDTPKPQTFSGLSSAEIADKIYRLNLEYQELRDDQSGQALGRRSEIKGELRRLRKLKIASEPRVAVQVPRSPTGHPIQLGPKTFWPGRHEVTISEAEDLAWIIDQQQQAEMKRMQQNGRTIDLSDPQSRVRALLAED